jgi:hypothetical protein
MENQLPLSCQPFFDYKCIYFMTKVQREDWVNDPLWRKKASNFLPIYRSVLGVCISVLRGEKGDKVLKLLF